MTLCVVNSSLPSEWFYPVIDPYRTAGAGPYHYGYVFAWDAVEITVTRDLARPRCNMRVEIISTLAETKQIQAFNFFNNTSNDMIDSDPTGALTSMTITKWMAGQACSAGTDTVVLARAGQFGPKLMYTFGTNDFWDFWGGCTVRFTWVADTDYNRRAWAPSGALTPPPTYPAVRLPDATLMRNAAGTGLSVVFGGTDFPADPGFLGALAVDTSAATARATLERDPRNQFGMVSVRDRTLLAGAVPFTPLPPIPADFTLVREWNRPEVYVVFGGAKFRIPDPPTLFALGFNWSMVRVIPAGGTSKLLTMPIDRTLIKEQHDPSVFVVANQELRLVTPAVMEAECLPWPHVRVVPDTTLSTLPHAP
jgi:hypothetical protein